MTVEPVACDEIQLELRNHTAADRNSSEIEIDEDGNSPGKCENGPEENCIFSNHYDNNVLDQYSKVIFPITFLMFIVCYALVCLSAQ